MLKGNVYNYFGIFYELLHSVSCLFSQASLDSELGKMKGGLTGFVSLCREILSRFVEQYFPTKIDNPVSNIV